MSSANAVAAQLAVSASNYAIFVLFAWLLEPEAFISFSTAVGLNMLAVATAEGGVSYVAPRDLAPLQGLEKGRLGAALLTLSITLYLLGMVGGFAAWNALADEPLALDWVAAYGIHVLPALLIPSWITCWSLDWPGALALGTVRVGIVAAAALAPEPSTLALSGIASLVLVAWLLRRLNRTEPIVTRPTFGAVRSATSSLSAVFVAKTLSYGMYAVAPLVIGVARGSSAASAYVTGERLKGLYTTAFQPVIQTAYLAQFQREPSSHRRKLVPFAVQAVNGVGCLLALVAVNAGALAVLGDRFAGLEQVSLYVLAGGFSVASAGILYFRIFPAAAFDTFRRATFAQMGAFVVLFVVVVSVPRFGVGWVLGIGEAVLLAVLMISLPRQAPVAISPGGDPAPQPRRS